MVQQLFGKDYKIPLHLSSKFESLKDADAHFLHYSVDLGLAEFTLFAKYCQDSYMIIFANKLINLLSKITNLEIDVDGNIKNSIHQISIQFGRAYSREVIVKLNKAIVPNSEDAFAKLHKLAEDCQADEHAQVFVTNPIDFQFRFWWD